MPKKYEPKPAMDARTETQSLRAALGRYTAHASPLADLPIRGTVSQAVWDPFHFIHCAHHLSFAVPAGLEDK